MLCCGNERGMGIRLEKDMDCIRIKKLEIFARHGALLEENVLGQKFVVSVNLYCSVRRAGITDDLQQSVNYAKVSEFIKEKTQKNTFRLIERLAEYLAQEILLHFPVQSVEVEVEKPWAPVHLPLETVSVQICRGWHTLYLSIGSNMGDKKAHLDQAIESMKKDVWTQVERISSYIETKPVGEVEQDNFLNAALCVRTLRTPEEFLELIDQVEAEQKRERKVHWGPRTIDVDILLYDDEIIQSEKLTIPHKEMTKREFVLKPMMEIAPYKRHPVSGQTMEELLEHV